MRRSRLWVTLGLGSALTAGAFSVGVYVSAINRSGQTETIAISRQVPSKSTGNPWDKDPIVGYLPGSQSEKYAQAVASSPSTASTAEAPGKRWWDSYPDAPSPTPPPNTVEATIAPDPQPDTVTGQEATIDWIVLLYILAGVLLTAIAIGCYSVLRRFVKAESPDDAGLLSRRQSVALWTSVAASCAILLWAWALRDVGGYRESQIMHRAGVPLACVAIVTAASMASLHRRKTP